MVAGCGNQTVKLLVFIFNFLIFVAGAVILGVSLWAALDPNFLSNIPKKINEALASTDFDLKSYTTAFYVLAVIGGFLMLVGFLGCCGAACENRLLLGLFFIIVLVLTVAQLGAVIAAFVKKGDMYNYIEKNLQKIWADTSQGEEHKALRPIEDSFKCCGVKTGDTDQYCDDKKYTGGCMDAIWGEIKKNMVVVGAIGIVVIVIEVLAMLFSCILCGAYGRRAGYYT